MIVAQGLLMELHEKAISSVFESIIKNQILAA